MGLPLLVIAVGTSFTARGDWSSLVAALEACHQRPVRFINAGKGGANSRHGVKIARSLAEMRPDVVSIEFAGNDADIRSAMLLAESERNMRTVIDTFRSTNSVVQLFVILTPNPCGPKGWLRPFLGLYYQRHAWIAQRFEVTVIDIRRTFCALPLSERGRLSPDGVHLTEHGFASVAAPTIIASMNLKHRDEISI